MWFGYFFFFKQKTAYEMRISDWSSDVCSSDLVRRLSGRPCGREYGRSVCSYGLHQNNDFAALLRRAPAQPKFEQAIVHTHCFGHGVDAVFEAGKHVIEIAAALVRRVELDAKRHRSIHRLQTCGLGQYQAIGPILLCSAALARPEIGRAHV